MGDVKVALTGRIRSGKSTLQGHAILAHDFQPFAFGDAMKDAAHRAFPNVARTPKPRSLYQSFGEWARGHFGANVWVDAVERQIASYQTGRCACKPTRLLVTDLRMPHEYNWLRAQGFVIVRVTAPADVRLARAKAAGDAFSAVDLEHETERYVDGFAVDAEIVNDGTVDEMTAQFDAIVRELNGKGAV